MSAARAAAVIFATGAAVVLLGLAMLAAAVLL